MLIAWDNKADGAVLTAGSEVATLPASNVQQPHLSRKWHTLPGVLSSHVVFDMLTPVSCAVLALLGTNLTSNATVRLRAADTDTTDPAELLLDSQSVGAGAKEGYGAVYKSFCAVSTRYWRLDVADATLPDNLQIGRVFLGPSWEFSTSGANAGGGQEWNWSVQVIDSSEIVESTGGQEYADERPRRRQLQFVLHWLTKAEAYDNALAMALANGIVRDVLAIPSIDDTYLSEQAVFGRLQAHEPIFHRLVNHWSQKFTIRERL